MAKRNRSRAQREALRHKILLRTGAIKIIGATVWFHHLRLGNLTRETEDQNFAAQLARDPLLAVERPGLIAFEDESTGELKFEQSHRELFPRRLPDGPPVSAQSTWVLTEQEFLLLGELTRNEVDELTRALKPCVQVPDLFDPKSRLVDPGVTLYR